jgi:hypothetical protein
LATTRSTAREEPRPPGSTATTGGSRVLPDVLVALALGLAFLLLYRWTFQARQFGDGALLMRIFAADRGGGARWYHALYMPTATALWRAFPWPSPAEVLRLLSYGSGALGVALAFGLARAWGARRPAAVLAALLLGVTPAWWFFSTTVEVHALHAACVGLCALVTLLAPWRRPAVAAPLVALLLPLVFLSHQSGALLGPGFVGLAQVARRRAGLDPLRWGVLLGWVAPVLALGFVAGLALTATHLGVPLARVFDRTSGTIEVFDQAAPWRNALRGWIAPLALLLPAALAALATPGLRGWRLTAFAAFVAPSTAFFLWWGLPERGAYALGTAPLLCVAAALAFSLRGRAVLPLALACVIVQAGIGYTRLAAFDAPVWRERLEARAAAVSGVLPAGGCLVSINPQFQYIEAALPDVYELNLNGFLSKALGAGEPPARFVETVAPLVRERFEGSQGRMALDLSYRRFLEQRGRQALPYAEALEAWLERDYVLAPVDDPDWPMARIGADTGPERTGGGR